MTFFKVSVLQLLCYTVEMMIESSWCEVRMVESIAVNVLAEDECPQECSLVNADVRKSALACGLGQDS